MTSRTKIELTQCLDYDEDMDVAVHTSHTTKKKKMVYAVKKHMELKERKRKFNKITCLPDPPKK